MPDEPLPIKDDLWGYKKRLRFVSDSIAEAFPDRQAAEISILDVGCGSGSQLAIPLAEMGFRLTGIDLHEPSIEVARDKSRELDNVSFTCGLVENLAGEFDIVILSEVLEHVEEPGKLLAASFLRLKPEGLLIVTIPNGYGEFEWDSWVFRTLGLEHFVERLIAKNGNGTSTAISSTENVGNRHIQFFSLRRIRTLFEVLGLSIVRRQASTLMSGPFVGHLLGRFDRFIDWNSRVADRLPMIMSSGWFFALRRRPEVGE